MWWLFNYELLNWADDCLERCCADKVRRRRQCIVQYQAFNALAMTDAWNDKWIKLSGKQLTPGPLSQQGAEPDCDTTCSDFRSSDPSTDHHIYWYVSKVGYLVVHCGYFEAEVLLRHSLQMMRFTVRNLILMLDSLRGSARIYYIQIVHSSCPFLH